MMHLKETMETMEKKIDYSKPIPKPQVKIISIAHYHQLRKPWILMPYGYYYNKELQTAREGDILLFSDGKRREIEYISPIKLQCGMTSYLCRKTYRVSLPKVIERWEFNATMEGHDTNVINKDRCLLIFLKEENENEE